MAPSTCQAPRPSHHPTNSLQMVVVLSIFRGSSFSHIPRSCKSHPFSPRNSCSWPQRSPLHARSAALRLGTIDIWGWITLCGRDHPVSCRLSSSIPGLCPPDARSAPYILVMPVKAVSRLYQMPPGDKTTLLGNHCVRLWPQPPVTCDHQTIVPHLHTAFNGSPLSTTKTHTLSLTFEALHHQPPAC